MIGNGSWNSDEIMVKMALETSLDVALEMVEIAVLTPVYMAL